jgi:hypothetical protein
VLSTILLMVVILAVGSRAADNLRLRQEEIVLHKLPVNEAADYYEQLGRRIRRVRILRAVAVLSLLLMILAYKHRFAQKGGGGPAPLRAAPAAGAVESK